jgi:hypothetical protein
MRKRLLTFYGWLFAVCGIAFVFAAPLVTGLLNVAASMLPGARPLVEPGPTLWLGLAGSMMAMVAYLSLELARDEGQDAAWNTLLLSKGTSTALFCLFALLQRNTVFLVGAVVDGTIFLHLRILRRGASPGVLVSRMEPGKPFYEVWFAKLNDPTTRNALWLRYTLTRGPGPGEASCWYVFFDRQKGRVQSGRWDEPLTQWCASADSPFMLGGARLSPGRAQADHNGVSWDLSWSAAQAPAFGFIPPALELSGAASSGYETPVSLARFSGVIELDGIEHRFEGAPGCLGHVWGRRLAHDWRWAHAVFPGKDGESDAVFEILSARVRLGPWLSPRLTCANLWYEGRLYRSVGLWRGLRNISELEAGRWNFRVEAGGAVIEGECAPAADLTASLDYESPDGRRLICRNSKTGAMKLRVATGRRRAELATADGAAVEFVEGAP